MLRIDPATIPMPKMHQYMLGSISPRPIAFASTIDADGNANLAPFSFFNAIGSNPPMIIFSPARSGRDNTTKHTLNNADAMKEVVINIVNYPIVQQMSLASSAYPQGVNEFVKAGLTPIASEIVKPFRVKESIVQMECKVRDIIRTGATGGAGNIIICEIVLMHIDESILDEAGKPDPYKMDLVARMGGEYYCRVIPESIFTLAQPKDGSALGVDQLPEYIRNSHILSGNNLGQLGVFNTVPSDEEVKAVAHLVRHLQSWDEIEQQAKILIDKHAAWEGYKLLMMKEYGLI